ncbi:hypothetical protein DFQ12_2164 [Sphingobacterium detergens]|uniref:Uncharacterized protein n=1 Tax=Sphingobacterium detergens TaxID=1145106 RepID=A0A420BKN8_SPHD1|nr:hypothetical protein DFQ12_2164 [Sphingobacterium detergens]
MVVVTKGGPKSVYLAIVDSCGFLIKKIELFTYVNSSI